MTTSIKKILKELSDRITKQVYTIEGLDLSYVDTKEKHLEIFTYSTQKYEDAVRAGFDDKENGSLLLSKETFKGTSTIIYENRFLNIPESNGTNDDKTTPDFKEFSNTFSGNSNATHQKWINHYKKHKINGVYFFVGRRRKDDFDLVLFGVVNGEDKKEIKKKLRPIINTFLNKLNDFAIVFEKFRQNKKDLEKTATSAAISQVMARNMSHNIGSHVMNVLVNEKYLEVFNPEDLKSYRTELELINEDCKPNRQIAIYNNYVKSRMDYLADITFGTPVMLSNKKAYSDIFCELDKVRLLLENISGRGEKFRYSITFKHNGNELISDNDILLAIPNDVLGCQGIYNIIDNVIRNSSKHGNSSTDVEHCEFTINIRDIKKEEIDKTNENLKFEANSLYCVEIYDNIAIKDNSLIKKQNDILNNKILNDYNQLRSESLGMIEMDASAAYLRQLDIISINSDDYDVKTDEEIHNDTNFNILKAFNASTDESKTILGYRFFVKKPQEALIVTDTSDGLKNLDDFAKNGITIVSCEDFKKQLDRDNTFNHEFMVLEQGKGIEELIKCKTGSLPLREYRKDKNCIKNLLELKSEVISKSLWEWREEELKNDYSSEKVKLEFDGKPKLSDHSRFDSSFLDHLEQIKQCQNNGDISKAWESITSCSFHYEALSSKGQYVLPTIYDEHNKVIPFKESEYFEGLGKIENYIPRIKVAESMLSRIIVIDERIQDKLKDEEYRIPYSEHYKMSNIYVPEKSLLDLKDKKIVISKIDNFIAKITEDEKGNIPFKFNPNYDFLLVHYSILERAYGCLSEDDKKDDKGKILDRKEWINEWFKKHKDNATIVVTSGRGNIEDLPSYVRYVNLSSVTTALKEIKSKYLIHQILYSSRKTKKK